MELGSLSRETLAAALAAAVAILLAQSLVLLLRRFTRRRAHFLRMDRAAAGERRAARLLEDQGFVLLGAQVVAEHVVLVDDRSVTIQLRADYLVTKRDARYVAEVKTGALATRIETSATRRQMLEYRVAFQVDGVLLVDADAGTLHEVRFPLLERPAPRASPWPVLGVLAGVLVAAAALLMR